MNNDYINNNNMKDTNILKLVLPKGRLNKKVMKLLNDVGLGIEADDRCYIPRVSVKGFEAKIMKPQNIPQLVEVGSHDIGFTGYDWVAETGVAVTELSDLGYNPVTIVAAIPETLSMEELYSRKIVVASEYPEIASRYLEEKQLDYYLIRTFGATEVFPPDDADMIIDNTSTGRTLLEHNLKIIDRLMVSTTRMIANNECLQNPEKKARIDELMMLINGVMDARERVMLEMNVAAENLDAIVANLPCMRSPTVAPLFNDEGYAVKVAVKKKESATLIPRLKAMGAMDILEYECRKVVS